MSPSRLRTAALAALTFAGASATADGPIDRIVAVVNDELVLQSEVDALCESALGQVPASLPLEESERRKKQIRLETLNALIDDRLIEQQIQSSKITVQDDEIDRYIDLVKTQNNLNDEQFAAALQHEGLTLEMFRQKQREIYRKRKLLGRELQGKLQVSEKEIQERYQQDYLSEAGGESVRASHILFATPEGTSADQVQLAEKRAEKVLASLKGGGAFAELARTQSDDPSASLGGDLGWFRHGDMVPAFEKAAFGLKKGELSGLVRTRFGIHIILVTDRKVDQPPTLDEAAPKIRAQLEKDLEGRLVRGYIDDLRRKAWIDIKL